MRERGALIPRSLVEFFRAVERERKNTLFPIFFTLKFDERVSRFVANFRRSFFLLVMKNLEGLFSLPRIFIGERVSMASLAGYPSRIVKGLRRDRCQTFPVSLPCMFRDCTIHGDERPTLWLA